MSPTTYATKPAAGCCGTPACTCAACEGLTALVRPRFFAGQVLTETDLTALERYGIEAQRMHNRYLHGAGVICGLELTCEDCGDGVAIQPGYGLDPCGNSLVVPAPQHVDVARMIRDCVASERRLPSCEPPLTGPPPGCDDDQTWCITLRYREQPMRPVTPLAGSRKAAGSCGCGSPGGNCRCNGNGHSHDATGCGAGCTEYVSSADLPPGCEPTRIAECFEVGIHRCENACCGVADALEGTFPMRALECFRALEPVVASRVSPAQQRRLIAAALGHVGHKESTRKGLCDLYYAVAQLYTRDPMRTTCQLPPELQEIDCTPKGSDESSAHFGDRLRDGTQSLLLLVAAYVRECLCHALNPPCSAPCDDRIVLGCVTVRQGKALTICNLQCRQFAGSFVSQRYWLPVLPVATWALGLVCCFPLVGRTSGGRAALAEAMDRADPTGRLRTLAVEADFALPRSVLQRTRALAGMLRPGALRERFEPDESTVNLAAQLGRPADKVKDLLTANDIEVHAFIVFDKAILDQTELLWIPIAKTTDRLTMYVLDGKVVGFGPYDGPVAETG